MALTHEDVDILERWWVNKSRKNFLAYRMFMRNNYRGGWFLDDLASRLQNFYLDLKAGKRPILLIQSPPQHGKSWTITDFIAWISGRCPELKTIYATYSDTLGKRCNLGVQRQLDSEKYKKIFPGTRLGNRKNGAIRTLDLLEFLDEDNNITDGQFRNTTTGGSVTGESLNLGIIDDAVKGREQANKIAGSQKIWEWFTDDFGTRFSDEAGLLVIMTRWTTHDLIARLLEAEKRCKVVNYKAIATKDEMHRKTGEALFPELKTIDFLKSRQKIMSPNSWESLYQGNPTVMGGNLFKDDWWQWYKALPLLKYKFITADTAQKTKTYNDWTVFQCWGYGLDGKLYLIDKFREKLEAPELRREAEIFYRKHDQPRINLTDPTLRGMYIEDKSSGTGLIQELRKLNFKLVEVPRINDKVFRAEDSAPYIEAGRVVLSTEIPGIDNLTKEAREFPNSDYDDDIDTCMSAIEIAFINENKTDTLKAALEAD